METSDSPSPSPTRAESRSTVAAGMARRTFSYPLSLAVVVALLIMLTGGFIAWWNYRTGVTNVRQLAGRMFDQIARETVVQAEAFLEAQAVDARGFQLLGEGLEHAVQAQGLELVQGRMGQHGGIPWGQW